MGGEKLSGGGGLRNFRVVEKFLGVEKFSRGVVEKFFLGGELTFFRMR